MKGHDNRTRDDSLADGEAGSPVAGDRRSSPGNVAARRAAVTRDIARQRLEDFHETLRSLAVAVFGGQATVVAHLRRATGREWLTFVVDAADPVSLLHYEEFFPRERAFWIAYGRLVKPPNARFVVAIRPARGWCRTEALAPLFSMLQPAGGPT